MNVRDTFDGRLTAWLMADAAERAPDDLLDRVLERTARTRRRPAWLIPERWVPMSSFSAAVAAPRFPWRALGLAALLLLALVAGVALLAGAQPRALPAPFGPATNGLIAYSAAGDIYVADPVTGEARAVVTGPGVDLDPTWSADGARLAFVRRETGFDRLFIAGADGGDVHSVTPDGLAQIEGVTFSPDGSAIAFTYLGGQRRWLAVTRSDGTEVKRFDVGDLYVKGPSFRPPDGAEILFIGEDRLGAEGLYRIAADGSGLVALLVPRGHPIIHEASYSPDGTRIAYAIWSFAATFNVRTHVMAADGSGDRLLDPAKTGAWDAGVAWSNDGTRLAIVRGYYPYGYADTRGVIVPVDEGRAGVETDPAVIVSAECCPAFAWAPDDSVILWTPTDDAGRYQQQLLIDPATGEATVAPWPATSGPAWQRLAP